MVDESNLQEVELLTKRFRDYIDKVQTMLAKVGTALPESDGKNLPDGSEKLYTVITPEDAMAVNLQSVLTTLEKAIRNIEDISGVSAEKPSRYHRIDNEDSAGGEKRLFSVEELTFLETTFNKIVNASLEERDQIFKTLVKTGE